MKNNFSLLPEEISFRSAVMKFIAIIAVVRSKTYKFLFTSH